MEKKVLKVVIMKYVYYIMHFRTMNHEKRLSKVITLKFYIMKIVTQFFLILKVKWAKCIPYICHILFHSIKHIITLVPFIQSITLSFKLLSL